MVKSLSSLLRASHLQYENIREILMMLWLKFSAYFIDFEFKLSFNIITS